MTGELLEEVLKIAVCGARGSGKSSLIDGLCQRHVSVPTRERGVRRSGRGVSLRTGDVGRRYLFDERVSLYEIDIAVAATMDFLGFDFVFVVFEHSAAQLECQTSTRVHDLGIPLAFVGTKADHHAKRLTEFRAVPDHALVKETRAIYNSKASKHWFALPEAQRVLYIVSNFALFHPADRRFDEKAILARFQHIIETTIPATLNGAVANQVINRGSRFCEPTSLEPSTVNLTEFMGNSTAASKLIQSRYREARLGPLPQRKVPPQEQQYTTYVAFLEPPIDDNKGQPTVMENVLGYKPNVAQNQTIVPHTPYKHPDHSHACFVLIPLPAHLKDVQDYFVFNDLMRMRLIVVVVPSASFKDTHLNVVKFARKQGIDVVVVSKEPEEKSSPRKALEKIKKITGGEATQKLHKAGLVSVSVFHVNPRILRITNSYPQTEEEEFKAYVTQVCVGKTPASRKAGGMPPGSVGMTRKQNAFDGSSIFQSAGPVYETNTYVPTKRAAEPTPLKPALKPVVDTPKSVAFDCRDDIVVAVLGSFSVGKTTLIKHTLGAPTTSSVEGDVWSVRHPDYYQLLFKDYPGYDPYDANVGTNEWMYKYQLHTADWILLVFNEALDEAELSIIQFCRNSKMPIICIATKADLVVDRFIYDKNLTENSAVEKTRSVIFQQYWQDMEEFKIDPPPLFILSARALEYNNKKKAGQFDEQQYLQMIQVQLATQRR